MGERRARRATPAPRTKKRAQRDARLAIGVRHNAKDGGRRPHSAASLSDFVEFLAPGSQKRDHLFMQGLQACQILVRWALRGLEGDQANAFKALEDPAQGGPISRFAELIGDRLSRGGELLAQAVLGEP